MKLDFCLIALGMVMIPMASAAQDDPDTFEIEGILYQEIEPVSDNLKEVMVCSPTVQGREYQLPILGGTINIPSQVEYNGILYAVSAIEDKTFYDEPRLECIVLPESVVTIGVNNFSMCENLHTLDLSQVILYSTPLNRSLSLSVTGSPSLKTLFLPETLAETLWWSFVGEYELETLHLPKIISGYASFIGCLHGLASVSTIYSLSPIPPLFDSGIDGMSIDELLGEYWYLFGNRNVWNNQPTIYVPQGCVEAYKGSRSWHYYNDIREYSPSAIETVSLSDDYVAYTFLDGKIVASDNIPVTVYDLCGRMIPNDNLPSGIYVVSHGNRTRKFVVRN